MIDLSEVCALTEFQRNAKSHIRRIARTGRPQVLTVNGRAAVVIQDAASYQRLLEQIDRAEAVAGIRRGLAAMKRRASRPLAAVLDDLKRKHERRKR